MSNRSNLHILLPRNIHIHHIDQNPKNNDINNLIFLRADHHQQVHAAIRRGEIESTRKGINQYLRKRQILSYFLAVVTPEEWRASNGKQK